MFRDDMYRKYHAIQMEVRRRLYNNLAWAVNYTGSITEQYTSFDWFRTEEENRDRNTHRNGSRPHNLKFTYNWMLPSPSRFLGNNIVARGALDGWQFSGISTALSGTGRPSASTGAARRRLAELTGGLGGSRVIIVCDPNLPRGERTFERQYRTECVRPPGPLTDANDVLYQGTGLGRGTQDAWMSLGYVNHDFTLMKNFGLQTTATCRCASRCTTRSTRRSTWREHDRDVQLRDRRADQPGVRFHQRRRANSFRVIQVAARLTF
jgi:hypothetical protein